MPKREHDRARGYNELDYASGGRGLFSGERPSYQEHVGKILQVKSVTASAYDTLVLFKRLDNGALYSAHLSLGRDCVSGLAFLDDIDSARALLLNRRIWLAEPFAYSEIESPDGRSNPVSLPSFAVTVEDVVLSDDNSSPVRLVLRTADDQLCHLDVTVSHTNGTLFDDVYSFRMKVLSDSVVETINKMVSAYKGLDVGKTFWLHARSLRGSSPNYPKYSSFVVLDVDTGTSLKSSLHFTLKDPNGQKQDFTCSHSEFKAKFLDTDPHLNRNWPSDIWARIEEEKVSIGMSQEQVRLSWEAPSRSTPTKTITEGIIVESWIYVDQHQILTFRNGELVTISDY